MVENEAAVPTDQLPPLYMLAGAGLLPGFSRGEVIIGGLVFVLLHETGHAVFDIRKSRGLDTRRTPLIKLPDLCCFNLVRPPL
jgi:hypothetical protein